MEGWDPRVRAVEITKSQLTGQTSQEEDKINERKMKRRKGKKGKDAHASQVPSVRCLRSSATACVLLRLDGSSVEVEKEKQRVT